MRCNRCGYSVPEWLWLAGDHPILVQAGTRIENLEMLEQNIFRVSTTETVQIKLCSEVNPGNPLENALRRMEETSHEQEQSVRSSPSFAEAVSSGSAVPEVRTTDGAKGEASTEPEVGLTAVCPNCKRSVALEGEHWRGNLSLNPRGFWTCQQKEV